MFSSGFAYQLEARYNSFPTKEKMFTGGCGQLHLVLDRYSKINFLMDTRNGSYSFKQQK